MMTDRMLLYIDLLGFSEAVKKRKDLLPALFKVLDQSNAHRHGDFRVIQFSDTLLVFTETDVLEERWRSYCAMYLSEFAQEIQHMLLGRDTFLRGLITYGQFEDTGPNPNDDYRHLRAFWGEALIRAHEMEKSIQAVGLFVDATVHPYMDIFETHPYDEAKGLWFVDTARMLRNMLFEGDDFSYAKLALEATGNAPLMAYDLFYLKRLYENAHDTSLPPVVRTKYQTTWEVYRIKYSGLCRALEMAQFEFGRVIDLDWKPLVAKIGTEDGFYG